MKYKTCVSIAEKNPKKIKHILKIALGKSEYAEVRLDFLKPSDIPNVLESIKNRLPRCVCTLRPKNEGGKFTGSEKERKSILKLISEYNPFLLDVEFNTLKKDQKLRQYLKKSKTVILVSWHDFKKTPNIKKLNSTLKEMRKFSNHVKIVTVAKSINDTSNILSLYNKSSKIKLIAFAMGEEARFSRILCLHLGSPFTYVSLGKAIASGQFSLNDIKSFQ
jgi:3-dehydroquinate dehydratase-1|tara:strand:+ start:1733 stop:2392 length:660 start_codon:yes stop_codon:yes gene_type:complete